MKNHAVILIIALILSTVAGVAAFQHPVELYQQFLPIIIRPYGANQFQTKQFFYEPEAGYISNNITDIEPLPDGRVLVVSQRGVIQVVDKQGQPSAELFLDLTDRVTVDLEERGLYEVELHPQFTTNGYFYLSYAHTTSTQQKTLRFSRFQLANGRQDKADPNSEMIVLEVTKTYNAHNGGSLAFSPDGYLYIAVGDGVQKELPQDMTSLFGKILRIDVDSAEPYTIPPTNPFVNNPNPDVRGEIWALGVRNPWKMEIDPISGDMYIADVGAENYEELNYQPATSRGGENYGWPCYEGKSVFQTTYCTADKILTAPIWDYKHENGRCSIDGGFVYRGTKFSNWQGAYIFGDFCTGEVFTAKQKSNTDWEIDRVGILPWLFVTFGQDAEGEIFTTTYKNHEILRIVPMP